MKIFDCLLPKNLIYSIPYFKSKNSDICGRDKEFIKEQLLKAEENHSLIRLVRGEGRKFILDSIIDNPDIIFDWGEKSMHSFFETSEVRDFLEPNEVNKELLLRLLNLYEKELDYHYDRYFKKHYTGLKSDCGDKIINKIRKAIENSDSYDDLIIIKEWLCYALHTGGNKKFSDISPWVSTSMGNNRYKTGYLYGHGNCNIFNPKNKSSIFNRRFVILDYWVPTYEEGVTYKNANYVGEKLRSMGLPWYHNKDNEVMVKYGLLPHRLIGYYYFENDELKYYFVNHHYLDEWNKNDNFNIGDDLYIDQIDVDFPNKNPYRIIYVKHGRSFSIYNRR
ncbi:TPA: hypothetical protein N2E03_003751 [Clostridium botulinum]|nr:hypothetical protein [Clostridium botulinum]HCL4561046.1 hypothetical protein [Clostridium botulinum]HCL4568874.1 hypothetical protein [Clostridium botulinum]HCL4571813.1 hypothetical protein [Clostridium botulinum]HCL4582716.1 hypothetical protein [Clostridium botulinum]